MAGTSFDFKNYVRAGYFPHIWCPGCGHGIVLSTLLRAIHEMGLDKNNIVMTSGIGCSSRISGYVDFHSLHTIHGRALAFATGVKLSRPELTVLVPMGDGDSLSIGGNHFIHAARRNIDITAIVMNNTYYGRKNGEGDAPQMMEMFRDNTVPAGSAKLEKNPHLIQRGIFVEDVEKKEYCQAYQRLMERAMKGEG